MHRLGSLLIALSLLSTNAADRGALNLNSIQGAHFNFSGPIGDRASRNVDEWLLRAPAANPGMLEMFRVRDRSPTPQLVPWAGEFVGKYLLSAIQALRMSDDSRLRAEVERAGDYLRTGLNKTEFYKTPTPRWESLHDLQGLIELYRITGEKKYRDAFEHHWRSIARHDIHNTGGFSSGEQATGNPYTPGAIETCCTIAWTALSIDMLRLTGDPEIADYLELATFNGGIGSQHPTGRWWTYNTPMDGVREASAHTIVFQSRAGTPELNCCSVNGPRALGMLSEWAVMLELSNARATVVINTYIPGKYTLPLGIQFEITGNYPLSNEAEIHWITAPIHPIPVRYRHGLIYREAKSGQRIQVQFDMPLRVEHGAREATNRDSVYRGPILLAYDQALNTFDEKSIPPVTEQSLQNAKTEIVYNATYPLSPWLQVTLTNGLRLCDFASAGARGTRYKTWLRTKPLTTSPDGLLLDIPAEQETTGANMFTYTIEEFPDTDYSVSLRVKLLDIPANRLAQIFSAWTAGSDDPLRLVLDKGKLHARIENPAGSSSTAPVAIATNEWHHIAATKIGNRLHLYINGQKRAETSAPANLITNSREVALGGNPRYTGGNESLHAQFSNLKFYARALTPEEIQHLAK